MTQIVRPTVRYLVSSSPSSPPTSRRRRRGAAAARQFFVVWPLQLLPVLPPAIRCPPLRRPPPCAPYLRGWHLGVTRATEGALFCIDLRLTKQWHIMCIIPAQLPPLQYQDSFAAHCPFGNDNLPSSGAGLYLQSALFVFCIPIIRRLQVFATHRDHRRHRIFASHYDHTPEGGVKPYQYSVPDHRGCRSLVTSEQPAHQGHFLSTPTPRASSTCPSTLCGK